MSSLCFRWRWLMVCLAFGLAACSGAGPQLIGTYPKEIGSSTRASPPANLLIAYNAYMELEVSNLDRAAEQATQVTYDHGGYLVSSDTWSSEGRKCATLTLAVPVLQFDPVHAALLDLGQLRREDISGQPVHVSPGGEGWNTFSNITVQLRTAASGFHISPPSLGWSPVRTFEQAFGVFASIFTWLVDLLIWLVVIVGPFGLMGWGLVALVKRVRSKGSKQL